MRHKTSLLLCLLLSLVLVLAMGGPVSAFQLLLLDGNYGDFGFLPGDSPDTPGARCGYTGRLADSYAHLAWIKVRPPQAIAVDSTPNRDHQTVGWQITIQRQVNGGKWKTWAT